MDPYQLFHEGKLNEAIDAAIQLVKSKPAELQHRTFLFELLAFGGDMDRAQRQLDVIGKQHSESEWGANVYSNLLAAESSRRELFASGKRPEFLEDVPEFIEHQLTALDHLREGRDADAQAEFAQAEEKQPNLTVTRGDVTVQGLRDCDDLVGPVLEIFILAEYIWMPYASLTELEISPPERPRDLLWAPIRFVTTDGTQRRGYMPVIYQGTHQSDDVELKLGRATDWQGPETGPIRGVGHRLLLLGEEAVPPLDLGSIEIKAE